MLKKKISAYLKKEQLLKNSAYGQLERPFLAKARKNLSVASLLMSISEKQEAKKALTLSADFETFEWVIAVAYYAMYTAALAALARLGFKSASHAATLAVLEYNFVHQ